MQLKTENSQIVAEIKRMRASLDSLHKMAERAQGRAHDGRIIQR